MIRKNLLVMLALFLVACGGSSGGDGNEEYEGYRVYANVLDSEDYTGGRYSGSWSRIQSAFEEDDWIYIGEATETATFTGLEGLTDIMITWAQEGIEFDAFDDPVGGASLGYDAEGNYIGIWMINNNLLYANNDDECIFGTPDGIYGTTGGFENGHLIFARMGTSDDNSLLTDMFRVTVRPANDPTQ